VMDAVVSACRIYDCKSCDYRRSGRCLGCRPGNLALDRGEGRTCRVYQCVESRRIGSCDECADPSCTLRRESESICPLRSRLENARWWAGKLSHALQTKGTGCVPSGPSEKVINRLRLYLTTLDSFAIDGRVAVSSWQIAERVGVSPTLIRKDLSRFGGFGTPSYGYRVDSLREELRRVLCLDKPKQVIWIGANALKISLDAKDRLQGHNCRLRAVFDSEEALIGARIDGLVVQPLEKIRDEVADGSVAAAVLAVQGAQALDTANLLAELGIRAILNLSGELLVLQPSIRVISVDLIGELLELCYYCQ
jgi:redox-sensing transcriptional repressor